MDNPIHDNVILIVEDDVFLRELLSRKLNLHFTNIDIARDGEEALDLLKKKQYSSIVLDLILPGIHGFDVMRKIKEQDANAQTPVIIFSNSDEKEQAATAKDLGAAEYLVKAHYTIDELIERMKNHIGKKTSTSRQSEPATTTESSSELATDTPVSENSVTDTATDNNTPPAS